MQTTRNGIFSYLKLFFLHFLGFSIFYTLGSVFHFFVPITLENYATWDGAWYKEIVYSGYSFDATKMSNVAFFPVFPLFWKLTGFNALVISLVNYLLYGIAIVTLSFELQFNRKLFLFILCMPLQVFYMVPFTESLFFVFITLAFWGYRKDYKSLIFIGLFAASATRPVLPMFLGGFIVLEMYRFLANSNRKYFIHFFNLSKNLLPVILGYFTAIYIHFHATGVWFAQAKTYKHWGGYLSIPEFPLHTFEMGNAGYFVLQLDYLAMAWSFYCGFLVVRDVIKKKFEFQNEQSLFVLCTSFMLIVLFIRLFTMHGSLWSLSRYVFASPIFLYTLYYVLIKKEDALKHLKTIFWLNFVLQAMFVHRGLINTWFVKFSAVNAFSGVYFLREKISEKYSNYLFYSVCLACFVLQLYFLNWYLKVIWVG